MAHDDPHQSGAVPCTGAEAKAFRWRRSMRTLHVRCGRTRPVQDRPGTVHSGPRAAGSTTFAPWTRVSSSSVMDRSPTWTDGECCIASTVRKFLARPCSRSVQRPNVSSHFSHGASGLVVGTYSPISFTAHSVALFVVVPLLRDRAINSSCDRKAGLRSRVRVHDRLSRLRSGPVAARHGEGLSITVRSPFRPATESAARMPGRPQESARSVRGAVRRRATGSWPAGDRVSRRPSPG